MNRLMVSRVASSWVPSKPPLAAAAATLHRIASSCLASCCKQNSCRASGSTPLVLSTRARSCFRASRAACFSSSFRFFSASSALSCCSAWIRRSSASARFRASSRSRARSFSCRRASRFAARSSSRILRRSARSSSRRSSSSCCLRAFSNARSARRCRACSHSLHSSCPWGAAPNPKNPPQNPPPPPPCCCGGGWPRAPLASSPRPRPSRSS
mmetsp:Transcript_114497/g.324330  ORF Transcript_114497/g.324330 Transcript_114497/m.324330 type:complete len:212 (+) Transcript_114497:1176-1811(+)